MLKSIESSRTATSFCCEAGPSVKSTVLCSNFGNLILLGEQAAKRLRLPHSTCLLFRAPRPMTSSYFAKGGLPYASLMPCS